MGRYQEIFEERIHQILLTTNPQFHRYVAPLDEHFFHWKKLDTPTILDRITHRRFLLYKKITDLTDTQLQRIGEHPKFGKMNILQWTEFFLLHETHHCYTIFQLIQTFQKNDSTTT